MNIFRNKKTNKYRIYCYLDETNRVKELAEKYAAKKSIVEIRAHGCLLRDNVRVTVTFKSKARVTTIYRAVLEEFKNYGINIHKNNISIHKEVGPE